MEELRLQQSSVCRTEKGAEKVSGWARLSLNRNPEPTSERPTAEALPKQNFPRRLKAYERRRLRLSECARRVHGVVCPVLPWARVTKGKGNLLAEREVWAG